jgi:hypothetical protein
MTPRGAHQHSNQAADEVPIDVPDLAPNIYRQTWNPREVIQTIQELDSISG